MIKNSSDRPRKIVILGGGTAGWMTAAALAHIIGEQMDSITLIESEQIGTVGVGEATIPHLRYFNQRLGIDEHEFMRRTNATYKSGIEFINWGRKGDSYIHPFGDFGFKAEGVHFYHYWLRAQKNNHAHSLFDYSLPIVAARQKRFDYPHSDKNSLLSTYSYAFHIDAAQYAIFLREFCAEKVQRIEGKLQQVEQDLDRGDILGLVLDDGRRIEGDFFIDCSGFRALLIEQTLASGFEDWSHWLACNRAFAVPTEKNGEPLPYTKATAQAAGWQWRIPLQHRTGNGHVFASEFISEDEAMTTLIDNLDAPMLAGVNSLKFTAGRRCKGWVKNCVAIGLSSGFLEPLESTSIYLIQASIMKLVELFPNGFDYSSQRIEYNRQLDVEYERIRDFLILHYHATEREDTAFWRYCKNMSIPTSLYEKIQAFKEDAYVVQYDKGLFLLPSWIAVYIGQGIIPAHYHPAADQLSDTDLDASLNNLRKNILTAVELLPSHHEAIRRHAAEQSPWPVAAMSLYGVFS